LADIFRLSELLGASYGSGDMNGERKTTFLLTGDLEGIGVLEETLSDPQQKANCTKKAENSGNGGL
jgi:hypothetical protein